MMLIQLLAYACTVIIAFGALNADMRAFQSNLERRFSSVPFTASQIREQRRNDLAMNVAFSLIPAINIAIATFGTGFLVNGWTLDVGPLPEEKSK